MLVCPFVSNKRQNGWTNRAHIFCGTLRDPRQDIWMIDFKNLLWIKFVFWKFWKYLDFFKSAKFLFVFVLQCYTKRTILNKKMGVKRSKRLLIYIKTDMFLQAYLMFFLLIKMYSFLCFKKYLILWYRVSHETWQLVNSLKCLLP